MDPRTAPLLGVHDLRSSKRIVMPCSFIDPSRSQSTQPRQLPRICSCALPLLRSTVASEWRIASAVSSDPRGVARYLRVALQRFDPVPIPIDPAEPTAAHCSCALPLLRSTVASEWRSVKSPATHDLRTVARYLKVALQIFEPSRSQSTEPSQLPRIASARFPCLALQSRQ